MKRRWLLGTGVALAPALLMPAIAHARSARADSKVNGDIRVVFLSQAEIDSISAKLDEGAQPWSTAYAALIAAADGFANATDHYSIVGNGGPDGGHTYESPPPSEGGDRHDYNQAIGIGKAVRTLGLAYAFTGDARYADRALFLMDKWMLDATTRMNPAYSDGQSYIELSITMPGIFYGAGLLHGYPGWAAGHRADILTWVADFAATGQTWEGYNNFENWRMVTLSSAGALLGDQALLDYAFARWKAIIPDQMTADGFFVYEVVRTTSLSYSTYALNAMTQTAEIARHYDVDLYGYANDAGQGLPLALNAHAPYVVDPESWDKGDQIEPYNGDNAALYEVAYQQYGEAGQKACVDRWGRPMYDIRTMGEVTLTHTRAE